MARLKELQAVVNDNHLESCAIFQSPTQWGAASEDGTDFEGEHPIKGGRMIVDGTQFYFTANLKGSDRGITTDTVEISEFLAAIEKGEENAFLGGEYPDEIRDLVEDCGGPILRGR